MIPEEFEGEILVWNMVVRVISIDVQGFGELTVALLAETFVVALERFALRSFRVHTRGQTFDLLFAPLAVAGEKSFRLAWSVFVARIGCVAFVDTLVALRTGFACLAA